MKRLLAASLLGGAAAWGATVRFDPGALEIGPFPADILTVEDHAQKTGRRINLPIPNCVTFVTACEEVATLNQYDGFSLTPRIRVRFSAPVDKESLPDGIFLVALANLSDEEYGTHPAGAVIPLNQLIWDPETLSLFAKPDNVLDQHRRYALIITSAVRNAQGAALEADPAFLRCVLQPHSSYCADLSAQLGSIRALAERLGATRRIIGASLFTTMSATSWLEMARDQLPLTPPAVHRTGSRNVVAVPEIASITFRQQIGVNPTGFREVAVPTNLLTGIGQIAFGSYRSPNYLNDRQLIPASATGSAITPPLKTEEIFFQALLPSSPKPIGGYPVVIVGHGLGVNRFTLPFGGAGRSMAAEGFAVLAINTVGHGFGDAGRLVIRERNGTVTELPSGGRGVDVNRDGTIGASEGCGGSDCIRQTALDLAQLAQSIGAGMDLVGDGLPLLDPERIYYFGHSQGAIYGTVLSAIAPGISSAVLNVGGGSETDILRWSPAFRSFLTLELSSRVPAVFPNQGGQFEDGYVLRDQPVKVSSIPGAIEIQNILEIRDWIQKPGDPLAYASHLRVSTLPGVPIKRVLFQFARGDQTVPNPANSALIRAAYGQEWSVLYRHDLARAAVPQLLANPHVFALMSGGEGAAIAVAAQRQAALFFRTGERCSLAEPCISDVADLLPAVFPRNLFEIATPPPEDLGFLLP